MADDDPLLGVALDDDRREHVGEGLVLGAILAGHDLVDHHGDGVWEFLMDFFERCLANEFRNEGFLGFVRDLTVRIVDGAFWQVLQEHVRDDVHLLAAGRRDGDHGCPLDAKFLADVVDVDEMADEAFLRDGVDLGGERDECRLVLELQDFAEDVLVTGTNAFVGREAHTDEVDFSPSVVDEGVESLAEQGAWLVEARGVDEDQLAVFAGDDTAHRVARGLRLRRGDGDLLPDQRVRERGLACVRAADEARET